MSYVIHNVKFPLSGRTDLVLPEFHSVVHVDFDRDPTTLETDSETLKLWYLRRNVVPDALVGHSRVVIHVVGTGHPLPGGPDFLQHLRTLVDPRTHYVWHLYLDKAY